MPISEHNCFYLGSSSLGVGGCSSLQVIVRFFTSLREITGKREEGLVFEKNERITIDFVLKELSKRHGRRFVDYVFDSGTGQVRGFLQFLVNGRSSFEIGGLDTELADGDILAIVPPVGGG